MTRSLFEWFRKFSTKPKKGLEFVANFETFLRFRDTYETRIYVQGSVQSLGSDCIEKEMRDEHLSELKELLDQAGFAADPKAFKRYGSARQLYNFKVDNASAY